jgi:hypothetical protein
MQTDNNKLFRSQVTEHATGRLYGDVLVAPRPSQLILTALLFLWSSALLYALVTLEWTEQERIEGLVERWPQTNQLIGNIYIPVAARRYIAPAQSFQATADIQALRTAVHLEVKRVSTVLTAHCPVCSATNGRSLYVRAEADIKDSSIYVDGNALQLAPGVRFHFMLPTRRQTIWGWVRSRGAAAGAEP